MNPNRKMCTMRRIGKITPIEGADRVEAVSVDGWVIVDEIGRWVTDELALYYEPDTAMPTNDPRYSHMAQWGEKTMNIDGVPTTVHVLKVRRFRGVYSQGYLAKPHDILPDSIPEYAYEEMCADRRSLDGLAGVCEYVPEMSATMGSSFIGKYDAFVAPRTDAERVQNISQDVFGLIKRASYFTSVKVDGTSITMCYDPRVSRYRIFSHNQEFNPDEPGIGMTAINCAKEQGLYDFCLENPGIAIQAELVGPKIQSNPLKLKRHRLYVFSMWDMNERHYLNPYGHDAIVPSCTPCLASRFLDDFETPGDLLEWVDGIKGNVEKNVLDEGVVVHVMGRGNLGDGEWITLYNALGSQLQMKAVSNRFLLKKGE